MEDDDLTPQEREFLEAVHGLPEDLQGAMLRAMNYIASHPEERPFTIEKMEALVESMKRLN